MKIDLSDMEGVLNEQENRDERQRGMEPGLILGCFLNLRNEDGSRREDDSYCQNCDKYTRCYPTLQAFKTDEKCC